MLHTSPSTLTPPRTGLKRKLEEDSPESVKCKRRINFAGNYSAVSQQPAAVARRNARERNRVKQVNNGFATLRQHIPGASKAKKISKVETLKQAVDYIRTLQDLLDENDYGSPSPNSNQSQISPIPNSVPVSSYEFPTTTASTLPPQETQKFHFNNSFYYNGESISPVCSSVYRGASTHSPTCSDGATASPSPSYISDSSSQLSTEGGHPIPNSAPMPEEQNMFLGDTFGGSFGMQMQYLEDEDFLEHCIENWESEHK